MWSFCPPGLLQIILRSKVMDDTSGNTADSSWMSMSELWTPGLGPLWTLAKGVKWYKKLKQLYCDTAASSGKTLTLINIWKELTWKLKKTNLWLGTSIQNKCQIKHYISEHVQIKCKLQYCLHLLDLILCYHWCYQSRAVPGKSSDTHLGLWVPAFRSEVQKQVQNHLFHLSFLLLISFSFLLPVSSQEDIIIKCRKYGEKVNERRK